jgi:hypothetical protein
VQAIIYNKYIGPYIARARFIAFYFDLSETNGPRKLYHRHARYREPKYVPPFDGEITLTDDVISPSLGEVAALDKRRFRDYVVDCFFKCIETRHAGDAPR